MLVILAIIALGALPRPVGAIEPAPGSRQNPGRLLVFTNGDPVVRAAVQREAQRRGGRAADEVRVRPDLSLISVDTPGAAAEFAGIPGVREVAPDVPPTPMAEAVDWGVTKVGAPTVWSMSPTITGSGVVVAVVDGGVDLQHPDLRANLLESSSERFHATCPDTTCVPGGADPNNDGHGTGVAGIVAAVRNNEVGTVGVSPGATILSVNCMEPGTFFSCLMGVYYAAGLDKDGVPVGTGPRARVVNMSWGWADRDLNRCASCKTVIQTVMQKSAATGVVLVAAAGNAGNVRGNGDNVIWPARTGIPLAVAATNSNDQRASFSSTGAQVDIAAPGVGITGPYGNGGYATWNGTSAASPHVAGAAALVLSAKPRAPTDPANNQIVGELLKSTALDLGAKGQDAQYGRGRLRADAAVLAP